MLIKKKILTKIKYKILLLLPITRKEHYKNIADIVVALQACNEYMAIMRNDLIQLANRINFENKNDEVEKIVETKDTNNHNRGMYE